MTPEQVKIIQKVAHIIAPRYTFGYYDVEDIEQECFLLSQEAVDKYDASLGSFETFLYTHLTYRLQNFLRRKYYRKDFDCKVCGGKDPNCESCERRRNRFLIKKHLMEPIDLDHVNCNNEQNTSYSFDPFQKVELDELFLIINKFLEIELRIDYLKMLEGITIPKVRRDFIENRIIEILEEHGYETEQIRPLVKA